MLSHESFNPETWPSQTKAEDSFSKTEWFLVVEEDPFLNSTWLTRGEGSAPGAA